MDDQTAAIIDAAINMAEAATGSMDGLVDRLLGTVPDEPPARVKRARRANYDSPHRRYQRLLRERAALAHVLQLPSPGEETVLVMDGTYHGWDFVAAILELATPATIRQLHIATLGFNRAQTHHLTQLLDAGQVGRVVMVVSEMFTEKNADEFALLNRELTPRGHRLANTRNHCKLLCFDLSDGRKVTLHGSMNLRRCHSYEQAALSTDPTLYRFFVDYIEDISQPTNPSA